MTWLPFFICSSGPLTLFACSACVIFANSKLLWASNTVSSMVLSIRIACIPLGSCSCSFRWLGTMGGMSQGDHPTCSMKGDTPDDAFTVFISSNLTFSNAFTQPFWFCCTQHYLDLYCTIIKITPSSTFHYCLTPQSVTCPHDRFPLLLNMRREENIQPSSFSCL